jgi:hypothetical protein
MIIMNSGMFMRFKLKTGDYIGVPIMFLSLGELWPQMPVQWLVLTLVQQVEAEGPMVRGQQKC